MKRCQKALKMDAYSESRQKAFAATKYILVVAKTKFTAVRIFRIKGQLNHQSLLATGKIPLVAVKTRYHDLLV